MKWYLWIWTLIFPVLLSAGEVGDWLEEAFDEYRLAERSSSPEERSRAFNRALAHYKNVEAQSRPNGILYFNIGNCYFQLAEYGWAIYYYEKARQLLPRDEKLNLNLEIAKNHAGVRDESRSSQALPEIFSFHHQLSNSEKWKLLYAGIVLTCFWWTLHLWFPSFLYAIFRALAILGCIVIAFSLLLSDVLAPVEGILIKGSRLYVDAGEQYASVGDRPLLPGSRVRIRFLSDEGSWIKVESSRGQGYVPASRVKVL